MANSKMGSMTGSRKSSYQKTNENKTRLIIRHNKTVDETSRGSRSRNISQIFIEDACGQRFLFPSTHLNGARAMSKHISRGGGMNDAVGNFIIGLSEEYADLVAFNKVARNKLVEDGDQQIVLSTKDRCRTISRILMSLKSFKGHTAYSQNLPVTEEYDADILDTTAAELASRCGCEIVSRQYYTAAKIKLSLAPIMQEGDVIDRSAQFANKFVDNRQRHADENGEGSIFQPNRSDQTISIEQFINTLNNRAEELIAEYDYDPRDNDTPEEIIDYMIDSNNETVAAGDMMSSYELPFEIKAVDLQNGTVDIVELTPKHPQLDYYNPSIDDPQNESLNMSKMLESWADSITGKFLNEHDAGPSRAEIHAAADDLQHFVKNNLDKDEMELKQEAHKTHGVAGSEAVTLLYHQLKSTGKGQ